MHTHYTVCLLVNINSCCRHTETAGIRFLTSKRRPLSLTVVPSGRLSFLGSGLEDDVLMMCFLEVFSWLTVIKRKKR